MQISRFTVTLTAKRTRRDYKVCGTNSGYSELDVHRLRVSDVNKDLARKAKAKDLVPEARDPSTSRTTSNNRLPKMRCKLETPLRW